MKKFYSIVLMAAALLIGTNVWATTVAKIGTAEYESFEEAWKAVKTGETIQLQENITIGTTLWLGTTDMADANPLSITLDLNGDTLTSTALKVFVLSHGSLTVTGEGGIKHAPTTTLYDGTEYYSAYEIFRVYGSTYKDIDAKTSDTYYTHLTIGAGVKLVAAVNGIVVDQFNALTASKKVSGAYVYNWKLADAWAAGNKTIPSTAAVYTDVYAKGKGVAHGVCIDVKGTIEARKYAIKANGNLCTPAMYSTKIGQESYRATQYSDRSSTRYVIAADDEKNYSPYIHVYSTAKLLTTETTRTDAVAAYGGGYARWLIEGGDGGYVEGSTAVYVKSGEVDIKNAIITSNFEGDRPASSEDRGSGVNAGGSGIEIESSANYAGGTEVTIEGNTVVTPTSGYALDERITNASGDSKVESVDIQGGTFKEGDAGTITVTNTTAGTSVSIDGGTFEYANEQGGGIDLGGKNLVEFLTDQATSGENTHTVVIDTDEQGHQTIVISEGDKPAVANSVIGAAENASINWKNDGTTTETLTADKKLTELQISQDYNQTLIVPDGLTLEVGRVVLGAKAQIVVEAGGKLVVTGAQGLASFQESNLVLKNEDGKRSIFLFHPSVSSNTHPMATIEFITKSWWEDANHYQWENFGLPTHTALTSITCDKVGGSDVYEEIQMLNGSTWTSLGYIGGNYNNPAYSGAVNPANLNVPFAAYNIIAYIAQDAIEKPKCRMSGELVGNANANLNANLKWTPFANSYTAPIDIYAFLSDLKVNATNVDGNALYVAEYAGNGSLVWNAKEIEDAEDDHLKVAPMQAFLLNNKGAYTEVNTINYNDAVYTPATTTTSSPVRRRMLDNNTTKMRIFVTNEEGVSDNVKLRESAVDNFEFEKYMNSELNIYATMTEEKSAIVAAENVANTYIGISTVKGGEFTISFANVAGREFDIIDLETGARINVAEGSEYTFTTAANYSNDYRFKVVEREEVATAIENTEAVKSVKGIYTITGQYVGEMNVWNTLPAGVYVVNGEKRVK